MIQIYPIDDQIFDLIVDLNKVGFDTTACCQGKMEVEDFDCFTGKHSSRAYIAFRNQFPKSIIESLQELNLFVYGTDEGDYRCVASIKHPEIDPVILCDANRAFQDNIRKVFKL